MKKQIHKITMVIMYLLIVGFLSLGNIYLPSIHASQNWIFADGGHEWGLNFSISQNAANPSIAVFNNELYVAWGEESPSNTNIRVKNITVPTGLLWMEAELPELIINLG